MDDTAREGGSHQNLEAGDFLCQPFFITRATIRFATTTTFVIPIILRISSTSFPRIEKTVTVPAA